MADVRGQRRNRRIVAISAAVVATLIVIIVVAVLVVRALRPDHCTTSFRADGVAPVVVTVPAAAGRPKISPAEAVSGSDLPLAAQATSKPVRIAADDFGDGTATITMTYDPATLPPRADPATDEEILTYVAGLWLPAGATIDIDAHTATVEV